MKPLAFLLLLACWTIASAQAPKFPAAAGPFARPASKVPALFKPEGAGPFPAVVLSHSCAGLTPNMYSWAERFAGAGYVVLIVDHLGPRGRKFNCPPLDHNVSVTEYAADAFEALRFLRAQSYVDADRIVQAGFSYGAMAGLRIASRSFARRNFGEGRHFAAVIALYPLCNTQSGPTRQDHMFNFYDDIDTPLLVLLGSADNETDPRTCVEHARKSAARGQPVEWKLYDNATHVFDNTNMAGQPVTFQRGPYTYRGDAAITEQAWRDMKAFLGKLERR